MFNLVEHYVIRIQNYLAQMDQQATFYLIKNYFVNMTDHLFYYHLIHFFQPRSLTENHKLPTNSSSDWRVLTCANQEFLNATKTDMR